MGRIRMQRTHESVAEGRAAPWPEGDSSRGSSDISGVASPDGYATHSDVYE